MTGRNGSSRGLLHRSPKPTAAVVTTAAKKSSVVLSCAIYVQLTAEEERNVIEREDEACIILRARPSWPPRDDRSSVAAEPSWARSVRGRFDRAKSVLLDCAILEIAGHETVLLARFMAFE